MPTKYAEKTSVAPERTRAEIEATLKRFGATGFLYATEGDAAVIMFTMRKRRVLFRLPLPERLLFRTQVQHEQAVRSAWRGLLLVIKAKLVAIESGVVSFESEFMAHFVIPGSEGQTVEDWLAPQLEEAYHTGAMPSLLPSADPPRIAPPSAQVRIEEAKE